MSDDRVLRRNVADIEGGRNHGQYETSVEGIPARFDPLGR